MTESTILVEQSDGIATVTLNRPDALNALSSELRQQLKEAIDQLENDPEVKVMILTGAGRAFTAGIDLKELGTKAGVLSSGGDVMTALEKFTGPIIGAINGVAITGGFELALACDVIIASTEARFADTHSRVGVLPGWGLSQRLTKAIGIYRAKELSLTGNFLSAELAEKWGLVNRVVAPDQLMPTCIALAKDMLSAVPDILTTYKQLIDEGYAGSFSAGMETEQRYFKASNKLLKPEDVENRRIGIKERGRGQTNS
ncbi:MAG: enoyl-CoA hydratase [Pseudomonadales bacterium]|nr:enoyl-CoA hydratase [Pseudomonadales bacterium]